MNKLISLTSTESDANRKFSALQTQALVASWLAKLLMRKNNPRSFVGSDTSGLHGKRLSGIQRIRVDEIVGTIRPTNDFDKDFRPLKRHSRERWVNILLQLKTRGWEPIVVHKVRECYYVAQGQYRVSAARFIGMRLIEAIVWDHSNCQAPHANCASKQKVVRRHTQTFSTN